MILLFSFILIGYYYFIIKSVLDKVDEVLIQLEAIKSTKKERQKLKPKATFAKTPKKPPNRLSMYGFPKIASKSVRKSLRPVKQMKKDEQITKTVSHLAINLYISWH